MHRSDLKISERSRANIFKMNTSTQVFINKKHFRVVQNVSKQILPFLHAMLMRFRPNIATLLSENAKLMQNYTQICRNCAKSCAPCPEISEIEGAIVHCQKRIIHSPLLNRNRSVTRPLSTDAEPFWPSMSTTQRSAYLRSEVNNSE